MSRVTGEDLMVAAQRAIESTLVRRVTLFNFCKLFLSTNLDLPLEGVGQPESLSGRSATGHGRPGWPAARPGS
jgi:hypothetical protein